MPMLKIEVNDMLFNWLKNSEYAQFVGTTPEEAAKFILITAVEKQIESGRERLWKSFEVFQLTGGSPRK